MKKLTNRLPELGRMRLGAERKGNRPGTPLDTFRFTSPERGVLDSISSLYGGEVTRWADQWQVIVTEKLIPVMIPPPSESWTPCSVTYEHWVSSGWDRRCDGEACVVWNEATDGTYDQGSVPCMCNLQEEADPHGSFERCKPVTRLNVIIQGIEPLGMFMLSSTGWNAAQELPGLTSALAAAMSRNIMVPASLRIESVTQRGFAFRSNKNQSGTVHFKKPVLEIRQSVNQLMGEEPLTPIQAPVDPITGELPSPY